LVLVSTLGASSLPPVAQLIDQMNARYLDAYKHGDADAIGALYTVDAVSIDGHNTVVKGRRAIIAKLQATFRVARLISGSCRADQVAVTGDEAWESGSCVYILEKNGAHILKPGRYLTRWRHEADGHWRIAVNVAG